MTVKRDEELDPVRLLIVKRAREISLNLADLSRAIGRNMSYVHQFIHRGSPIKLPEEVRNALADVLRLPEAALRPGSGGLREIVPLPSVNQPSYPQFLPSKVEAKSQDQTNSVPIFADEADLAQAIGWASLPSSIANGDHLFATWVHVDRGRLRAGDMVYFQTTQPPRPGDTIIVLEGSRIVEVGELLSVDDKIATVSGKSNVKNTYPMDSHKLHRAVLILCA